MASKDDDFQSAKRLYLEQFGSALVTNNYLRMALVCLALVAVGETWLMFRIESGARNRKPLVIRIDDVGRAAAVDYQTFEYKPQDRELRYFLGQFVTRHFSRMVATAQERYAESLYFLDRKLAESAIEDERKNQHLQKLLRESTEETDIEVKNISLDELRTQPFKASVDFERVVYSRADHRELRRQRVLGTFEFVIRSEVPNALIPVNPLGLTITYFRLDEAFR